MTTFILYFLLNLFFGSVYYACSRLLIKLKGVFTYNGFSDLEFSVENPKSYFLKIFFIPITSLFLSIFLAFFNQNQFIIFLIFIPIIYYLITAIIIIFLDRWSLINKRFFLITIFISLILNLILINFFALPEPLFIISNISYLFPDKDNLKSYFWWLILGYFLVLSYPQTHKKRGIGDLTKYLNVRHKKLKSDYGDLLESLSDENKKIIYAIMIYEDYNRSSIDRFFEKIVFYLKLRQNMSTGIMQIKNEKFLSNKDSVILAVKSLNEHLITDSPGYNFISKYNPNDREYINQVGYILNQLN